MRIEKTINTKDTTYQNFCIEKANLIALIDITVQGPNSIDSEISRIEKERFLKTHTVEFYLGREYCPKGDDSEFDTLDRDKIYHRKITSTSPASFEIALRKFDDVLGGIVKDYERVGKIYIGIGITKIKQ